MVLETRDLSIKIRGEEAVRSSSFSIPEGSITALIGESGSGKSLTACAVAGLLPDGASLSGEIIFRGEALNPSRIRELRGRYIAYVFQDAAAALNPVYTIGKQLRRILRKRETEGWLGRAGLGGKGKSYPFELSGGMQMRAELMMALSLSPALLIADEITASLDSGTAEAIMALVMKRKEEGCATLLITHDISMAARYSDRIAVMHAGETVEEGSSGEVLGHPLHPYTRALMESQRLEKDENGRFFTIPGRMPDPGRRPEGCTFRERCGEKCEERPSWRGDENHRVRCLHPLS